MHSKSSVLLIGSGRLAKHLIFWNSTLHVPNSLLCWDRTKNLDLLQKYLAEKPLVWLAISDSALIEFYEQHLGDRELKVLHFSGALWHEGMIAAHPLMSFPDSLFAQDFYEKIHFTVTGTDKLNLFLPGFNNAFSCIAPEHRPLYHALCVLAGNFPQILWNETLKELRRLEIPDGALETYINQIAANFINLKQKALTGPLIRKDNDTINKNIAALGACRHLQHIYESFAQEFRQ